MWERSMRGVPPKRVRVLVYLFFRSPKQRSASQAHILFVPQHWLRVVDTPNWNLWPMIARDAVVLYTLIHYEKGGCI
jgi:hypothetical protein